MTISSKNVISAAITWLRYREKALAGGTRVGNVSKQTELVWTEVDAWVWGEGGTNECQDRSQGSAGFVDVLL